MSNLDTQCKIFNIVLTSDKYDLTNRVLDLYEWFDSQCYLFACICHDKDFNTRTGVMKKKHYHIVLKCASRYRISTMLYRIADVLKLYTSDELSSIHVQKCDSLPNAIQYLTHKNNKDKYHYNFDEIITNFNDDDIQDLYNTKVDDEINVKYLTNLIKQGKSDFEIMGIIGLGRYHLYKGAINDIRYALQRYPKSVDQFLMSLESVDTHK